MTNNKFNTGGYIASVAVIPMMLQQIFKPFCSIYVNQII